MKLKFEDLLEMQICGVYRELKEWITPLIEITEQILLPDRPEVVIFKGEETPRIFFKKEYIDILGRTFRDGKWYLSQRSFRKDVVGHLLVIVLPRNHWVLLAPRVEAVNRND